MMFGNEKRFHKDLSVHPSGQLFSYCDNTSDGLGPGSYFASNDKRSQWIKPSFSKREPFSTTNTNDRSHLYTSGVLLSTGIAIPSSSTNEVNATPGPGAYNPYNGNNIGTPRSSRHNENESNLNPNKTYIMGSGKRLANSNAILKNGILFSSQCENSNGLGPGQYHISNDNLIKKSFNIRASTDKIGSNPVTPRGGMRSRGSTPNSKINPNHHAQANSNRKNARTIHNENVRLQTPTYINQVREDYYN